MSKGTAASSNAPAMRLSDKMPMAIEVKRAVESLGNEFVLISGNR